MIYKSTMIPRLEYEIMPNVVILTRDGESTVIETSDVANKKDDYCRFMPVMQEEMSRIYEAYIYMKKKERKMTLNDWLKVASILGISYKKMQMKQTLGELKI